jgi:ABC-type lipoprotein release transport system permease subunit
MTSIGNPGRFAGVLYVLTSIVGFFAMGYVPGKLIVHGNTAATVNNIAACLLAASALVASFIPARRAASLNPTEALRAE